MTINPKDVLKAVKDNKRNGDRFTLYFSKATYNKFKADCEKKGLSASKVLEEFMKRWLVEFGE